MAKQDLPEPVKLTGKLARAGVHLAFAGSISNKGSQAGRSMNDHADTQTAWFTFGTWTCPGFSLSRYGDFPSPLQSISGLADVLGDLVVSDGIPIVIGTGIMMLQLWHETLALIIWYVCFAIIVKIFEVVYKSSTLIITISIFPTPTSLVDSYTNVSWHKLAMCNVYMAALLYALKGCMKWFCLSCWGIRYRNRANNN